MGGDALLARVTTAVGATPVAFVAVRVTRAGLHTDTKCAWLEYGAGKILSWGRREVHLAIFCDFLVAFYVESGIASPAEERNTFSLRVGRAGADGAWI